MKWISISHADLAARSGMITTDFYAFALKKVRGGQFVYGRTKFDLQEGVMVFTQPKARRASVRRRSENYCGISEDIKNAIPARRFWC